MTTQGIRREGYDGTRNLGLTAEQERDLVEFLKTL
jgi:hypothetical protein